jgi:hypothetical protein
MGLFYVGTVLLTNGQRHTTTVIHSHTTTLSHIHCTTVWYCVPKAALYLAFIDNEVALRVETAAAAVVWASLIGL